MTLRYRLVLLAVLAMPASPALAQAPVGPYVGLGAGMNFQRQLQGGNVRLQAHQPGVVGLGSIGWGFGNGFRVELEGNFRRAAVDRLLIGNVRRGDRGDIDQYGGMANVLYDFNLSSFGIRPEVYQPYVGAGIGAMWINPRRAQINQPGSSFRVGDGDARFAYQAIVGSAFSLGSFAPGLALTAEYRYVGNVESKVSIDRVAGPAVAGVPGRFDASTQNHSVLLGLRYAFGAPAAAPAAPGAPVVAPSPVAPARTFLVFFDFNRADLTDRARQIIGEAAQTARRSQVARIEVAGHADRSGTPQYNQALSERRAQNVANELTRQGVKREEIAITAFGESRPLVATADGVREPQNRRVEIVLR